MPKDLIPTPPNLATRVALRPSPGDDSSVKQSIDLERLYLDVSQKLEQLLERKQRAVEETVDVAGLHQELSMIGSRIQREPDDPSHEEDYITVLRRVKESLWRKIEAEDLKGEFQKLHFELLGLGHKLGFDRPAPTPQREPKPSLSIERLADDPDEMNLGDVERQIAELQAQLRSLHRT